MPRIMTVSATEFARNFGAIREQAFALDHVKVTRRGRVVGAYLSAKELEIYERLKEREARSYKVTEGELREEWVKALEAAGHNNAPE